MYYCEICGKQCNKKIRYGGYTLCSKHMHQLQKYGKFLDSNPRSQNDKNKFIIKNDIAIFELYDQHYNVVDHFIIDIDDLDKVRDKKWRLSYGRVLTGNHTKTHPSTYLTHLLLNVSTSYDSVIDHIDGDPLNNRKCNLRICTQGQNTLNKTKVSNNTSGIIGVHPDNRQNRKNHWCAEIRLNNKQYHLGSYLTIAEAAYARYIGETILFKEYRNVTDDEIKQKLFATIDKKRQQQIKTYIETKINTK